MWEVYTEAREALNENGPLAALAVLERNAGVKSSIQDDLDCLSAHCRVRLGQSDIAIALLRQAAERGSRNFWVYHTLAGLQRDGGDFKAAMATSRQAHAAADWPESLQNGYVFTHDYFSANIFDWRKWFNTFIVAAPIECMEIGSWQGGPATWLLDNVVGPRGGRLTCIDTFEGSSEHATWLSSLEQKIEAIFDENIRRTGRGEQCRKLIGKSQDVLPSLYREQFDFIYIDGAHEAKYVILDNALCWGLLKPGGFLLFDDTHFTFPHAPAQNTQTAIAGFRSWFAEEIEVLTPLEARQLLVRKLVA
jgi:predicted O-methyltransferase YrrM